MSDYERRPDESVFEHHARVKKQKSIYRLTKARGLVTTSRTVSHIIAVGYLDKAIELLIQDLEERNNSGPRG